MSDEQQHGSVRSLTERAIDFAHAMADYDEYIKTVESLRAEADRLDARPLWPSSDEAVEALARAIHEADMQMDNEHAAWEDLTAWWMLRYRKTAAAVLHRLAEPRDTP